MEVPDVFRQVVDIQQHHHKGTFWAILEHMVEQFLIEVIVQEVVGDSRSNSWQHSDHWAMAVRHRSRPLSGLEWSCPSSPACGRALVQSSIVPLPLEPLDNWWIGHNVHSPSSVGCKFVYIVVHFRPEQELCDLHLEVVAILHVSIQLWVRPHFPDVFPEVVVLPDFGESENECIRVSWDQIKPERGCEWERKGTNPNRGQSSLQDRWRKRSGENESSSVTSNHVNASRWTGNVSTNVSKSLTKGPGDNVNLVHDSIPLTNSGSFLPIQSYGMNFIHERDCSVLVCNITQFFRWTDCSLN